MLSLEKILLIVLIVILILAIIILIVVLIKRKTNSKELFTGINISSTDYQNTLKQFVNSWVKTVNNTFTTKESFVQPRQTLRAALRKKEDYEKPRTGRSFKNLLV